MSFNDLNIINLNNKDWQTFIEQGQNSDPLEVLKRIGQVRMEDVATIMYSYCEELQTLKDVNKRLSEYLVKSWVFSNV